MAVFKKLKHKKDKQTTLPPLGSESVKQLDERIGLHTYRDFFTLKNYWKTVDRKKMQAAMIMFQRYNNFYDSNFN
ncbi:hypothetical protein ACH3XW_35180 [Acanthocheilonema viteae]